MTCTTIPGTPATAGSPPQITYSNVTGWNASADSTAIVDGDLHVVFTIGMSPVGAMCGFRSGVGPGVASPLSLTHAFMLTSKPRLTVAVYESGVAIPLPVLASTVIGIGDTLEIRRYKDVVTYWHTPVSGAPSATPVYTSLVRSSGPLVASACLYASGDAIG